MRKAFYVGISFKIRDRIRPGDQSLPLQIDESVAVYHTTVNRKARNIALYHLNDELRIKKKDIYRLHSVLYVGTLEGTCTVGFRRSQGRSGPITRICPAIILPEPGLAGLTEEAVNTIAARFEYPLNRGRINLQDITDQQQAKYFVARKMEVAFYFQHHPDLPALNAAAQKAAEELAAGKPELVKAYRKLLTLLEFESGIPVNPPVEETFSLDAYLAREAALLAQCNQPNL